jgi:hypothetical protein
MWMTDSLDVPGRAVAVTPIERQVHWWGSSVDGQWTCKKRLREVWHSIKLSTKAT